MNSGSTDINGELTADIDLSGINWTPIGVYSDDTFSKYFDQNSHMYSGIFDGNGYVISNLTIDASTSDDVNLENGLFGRTNYATLKNIRIKNANISSKYREGILCGEFV